MDECEVADTNCNVEAEDANSAIADEPVYALKEGLDLTNLRQGAIFELDLDADSEFPKEKEFFNDEALLNNLNIEDTVYNDEEDDLEPFESLKKKMVPIADGIHKRVKVDGHGIVVPDKSLVTIHYNNYVEYSDEPFDSTRLRNIPFKFILNTGAVIAGLDIGVSTMQTGEIAQLLISSDYAFGDMGVPPRIPPKATILCEVELISFLDSTDLADFNDMTPEEKKEASFLKKLNSCKTKNKIGNNYFKEKMYQKAIDQYRWAIKVLENATLADEEEEKQQQKLLANLHLNLSQCFIMQSKPRPAKMHARRTLDIQPDNTKAHFRLGKAHKMEGEFGLARKHLKQALRNEPNNVDIIEELKKVDKLEKQNKDMEKRLYQKMFGQHTSASPTDVIKQPAAAEEFKLTIEECLTKFKEDDNLVELPFSCGFSATDIACVKDIAKRMGLDTEEIKQGSDNSVRVVKKKELNVK